MLNHSLLRHAHYADRDFCDPENLNMTALASYEVAG